MPHLIPSHVQVNHYPENTGFGEFFPADLLEGLMGKTFLDFFQTAKESRTPKGVLLETGSET